MAILNDLEGDGLAERRRDPADRRRHIVQITQQGAKLAAELHATVVAIEAELLADLDEAEIAVLQHLLGRVRTAAEGAGCTEEA